MKPPRKDPVAMLLEGILVLNAALVYAAAARSMHTVLIALFGVIAANLVFRPIPRTSRTVIYATVAVLVVATIESQVFPVRDSRFFLSQTTIYCPVLIYGAVAMMFFDHRRIVPPLIASCAIFCLLLAGSCLGLPAATGGAVQRGIARNFKIAYHAAAVVQVVTMVVLFQRAFIATGEERRGGRLIRWSVLAFLLACVFGGSAAVGRGARHLEPQLSRWYAELIRLYLIGSPRRVMFDDEVDLWETVPTRSARDATVVLRAFSPSAPGYLRGRVYDSYADGMWQYDRKSRALPGVASSGLRAYTTFRRQSADSPGDLEAMGFLVDATLVGDVIFVPGTGQVFELVADALNEDPAGVLTHVDWEQRAGYRVLRRVAGDDAYPLPVPEDAELDLWRQLPETLRPDLDELAGKVFPGENDGTDRQRMAQVVSFLNRQCDYELGTRMSRARGAGGAPGDPIVQFVNINRKGHCELFASAAALLLRHAGIPARYVTGFVCVESAGAYWLARLEHAHAWVEAYDSQTRQWVLVEATPPGGLPAYQPRFGILAAFADWVKTWWLELMARVRRGEFAELLAGAFHATYAALKNALLSPLFWTAVLLGTLAVAGKRRWARYRRRPHDPELAELAEIIGRVERMAARMGVRREENETLRELGRRVADRNPARAEPLNRFLESYQRLRYRPDARSRQAVRELGRQWRNMARTKLGQG